MNTATSAPQEQKVKYGSFPVDNYNAPEDRESWEMDDTALGSLSMLADGPFSRDIFQYLIPNIVMAPYLTDEKGVPSSKLKTASATKAFQRSAGECDVDNAGYVFSATQCYKLQVLWNEREWGKLFAEDGCAKDSLTYLCSSEGSCLLALYKIIYVYPSQPWSEW